ncbi:2-phosphosulfolactate phosphatase family protein [Heliobacillus mobilis]|uniref:Probable 2-phosphosulfolactate phosphatase n=1 Tax=Heliobacterium mobile TaxID=28064 RepID=A0A6I3SNS3_HELMO|nr:2-phosphosulfolactate phosphatase [Heliobacterium mobile]MTV50549.1 2-phosphosulfolactate phosphatase family protein [Heliobacterium mobile]
MYVEVIATHQQVSKDDLEGKFVVVIDTLRATSTIVTALANGCQQVFPVATCNEAKVLSTSWEADRVLLGAEKRGHPIPGFPMGNSPRSFTPDKVAGKTLFLVTTNGTVALQKAHSASSVVLGALLNGQRVAEYIVEQEPEEVVMLCAGTQGHFSMEDVISAGKIMGHIWDRRTASANELAIAAFQLYQVNRDQLVPLMAQTAHGQSLLAQGDGDDLDFCLQEDLFPVVPQQTLSRVRLLAGYGRNSPYGQKENSGSCGISWHGSLGNA